MQAREAREEWSSTCWTAGTKLESRERREKSCARLGRVYSWLFWLPLGGSTFPGWVHDRAGSSTCCPPKDNLRPLLLLPTTTTTTTNTKSSRHSLILVFHCPHFFSRCSSPSSYRLITCWLAVPQRRNGSRRPCHAEACAPGYHRFSSSRSGKSQQRKRRPLLGYQPYLQSSKAAHQQSSTAAKQIANSWGNQISFTFILPLFPKLLEFYRDREAPDLIVHGKPNTLLQQVLGALNAYKASFSRPIDSRYDIVLLGGALGSLFS